MPIWLIVVAGLIVAAILVFGILARPAAPGPTDVRSGATTWDELRAEARMGSAEPSSSQTAEGTFRVRPGVSLHSRHWNPHDEEQSRRHRVQANRRQRLKGGPAPRPELRHTEHVARNRGYYRVLEVSDAATIAEIERSYRRLASRHHPDRFFDDPPRRALAERKLKELNEAVHVLRDPERRARYDGLRPRQS